MTVEAEARAPETAPAPADGWRARPVRLVLLLDAPAQPAWVAPAWVAQVLEAVTAGGAAVLVGVGVLSGARARPDASRAESAYLRLDARRYGRPDDPTHLVDLAPRLAGVPRVAVDVGATGEIDASGAESLRALGADVVWSLGAARLREPTPVLAEWGVLALDPTGGAHGARAMLEGAPATATTLRRLADARGAGGALGRVQTSTQRVSVTVNRAEHARHVAELVGGVLRRASRVGPRVLDPAGPVPNAPPKELPNAPRPLGLLDAVRLAARAAARLVRARVEEARTTPQWILAYHIADAPVPGAAADGAPPATDPHHFTELLPPADRYWADPFPVEVDGRYLVFYEEHLAGAPNAHLNVAELDPARGLVEPRIVLERDYHLSFPAVFEWQGAWYMTPETSTERAVQLYRAERFPDVWAYVGDLVAGERFVDPVVACFDGAWWMFVGAMPPGAGEATALHLYHAPTPLGPWTPHQLNPVAVDVRSARPAGRVFRRGGAYYRPVQDGAPHYGRAMAVHRIDALTPTTFGETVVGRVEPTWRPGLVGTHTLNAAGRLTVLDALRRAPRAPA